VVQERLLRIKAVLPEMVPGRESAVADVSDEMNEKGARSRARSEIWCLLAAR
jgi:hypothetical protein